MDCFRFLDAYTSSFVSMRWFTRDMLSERRFLGWPEILFRICLTAWVAGFISTVIEGRSSLALFDTIEVMMLWPLGVLLAGLLLAWAIKRLWSVSLEAAFTGVMTCLPVVFFIPVLNLLGERFDIQTNIGFAGGWQALALLISGGILPSPTVPVAILVVWFSLLIWISYSWWRTASVKSWRVLAEAVLPSYLLFPFIYLLPSFLGWTVLFGDISIWSSGSSLVGRAFTVSQIDGYVWRNVYQRFPLSIGGEAHISAQWLMLSVAFIVLSLLVPIYLARVWKWSWRTWVVFARPTWIVRAGGLVVLGVVAAYFFESRALVWHWSYVIAVLVLGVTTLQLMFTQAVDTDLAQASFGSLPATRPLAQGLVTSADLQSWRAIWIVTGAVGAWLLGWPIFLAYLLICIAGHQSLLVRSTWAYLAWSSFGQAGMFLIGWMIMVPKGGFGTLAPAFAALIFLLSLALGWRKSGR